MYTSKILILLDWDDTLYPTTWIVKNIIKNINNKFFEQLSKEDLFKNLDNLLFKFLNRCITYGETYIVTHANSFWVDSSLLSIPRTKKLIEKQIKIVSAKDKFGDYDIVYWKQMAFNEIINETCTDDLSIIAMGDSLYEHHALSVMNNNKSLKQKKNIHLKSIYFLPTPTINEVFSQLIQVYSKFPEFSFVNKNMKIKL